MASPASRWSQKQIDLISTMALDGHGIGSIAKALGRPRDYTGQIARKFGIRIVPPRTPNKVLFFMSGRLWSRLEAMAGDCNMKPAATARMIVMAVTRPVAMGERSDPERAC